MSSLEGSFPAIFLSFVFLTSCSHGYKRSGFVVDKDTRQPLEGASVEIYMKSVNEDSLKTKVFTDANGYFETKENRRKDQLFLIEKEGFIGHVSNLEKPNDTIMLERLDN